jgi:hypothetical protein
MMNADERQRAAERDALRDREPDEQRADEPRPARDGDPVDVVEPDARLRERAVDHREHVPDVLARRELRHDAAVRPVDRVLRRDDGRGERAVLEDGGRRVVARALDAEDDHSDDLLGGAASARRRLQREEDRVVTATDQEEEALPLARLAHRLLSTPASSSRPSGSPRGSRRRGGGPLRRRDRRARPASRRRP